MLGWRWIVWLRSWTGGVILWGRWSSLSRPTSLIVRHKWCVRRCNHVTRAPCRGPRISRTSLVWGHEQVHLSDPALQAEISDPPISCSPSSCLIPVKRMQAKTRMRTLLGKADSLAAMRPVDKLSSATVLQLSERGPSSTHATARSTHTVHCHTGKVLQPVPCIVSSQHIACLVFWSKSLTAC